MIKDLVEALFPLNRQLAGRDTDKALRLIGEAMPPESMYTVEEFPAGTEAWTWTIPKRWVCRKASLTARVGKKLVYQSVCNEPLSLVAHSVPIEATMGWDELEPHLYYSEERPDAVPWMFKYYEEDWGFCLSKTEYDKLPRDAEYSVYIDSEFLDQPGLCVATAKLGALGSGKREWKVGDQQYVSGVGEIVPYLPYEYANDELLIATHVCHPRQANDDAAGVSVAVEIANRLSRHPLPPDALAVRFLFGPETIGSVAWLSRHEDLIPHIKGGIFIEMAGTDGELRLVGAHPDGHPLNKMALYALKGTHEAIPIGRDLIGYPPEESPNSTYDIDVCEFPRYKHHYCEYGALPRNDEKVINGPGVDIPCISLSRWPYAEYHTSDDDLTIVHEDKLKEMADVVEEIIRIRATDYKPKRTFRGYLNMRRYGLWVDWRTNFKLNQALDKITHLCDGELSVFEISARVGLGYWETREWLDKLIEKGLVVKT